MARYIDADKATPYFYEHLTDNGMAGAQNALNEMPTEDVAPVIHAHWSTTKEGIPYCTHCNEDALWDDRDGSWLTEYCPNCGAKMDEEVDA